MSVPVLQKCATPMVLFQINASMPVVLPPFAAPEAALLILGLWLFVLEEKNPQLLPQTHREEEKLQLLPPPLSEMVRFVFADFAYSY